MTFHSKVARFLREEEGYHVSKVIKVEEGTFEQGCGEPVCNCTWEVPGVKVVWIDGQGLEDWDWWAGNLEGFVEMVTCI